MQIYTKKKKIIVHFENRKKFSIKPFRILYPKRLEFFGFAI